MTGELVTSIGELVDMGWNIKSQTESTAILETRRPINWWLFLLFFLFFFFVGALIYLIVWSLTAKANVFLAVKDGEVVQYGDSWLVERHKIIREKSIEKAQEIKKRGFWTVMWPSVILWIVIIGLWIWLIWWLVSIS